MHKYKQLTRRGFALPTLIIAGTILMIVGVSTLTASTSITKTLQDQQWNRLADEAAQAGVAFATSCLEKNKTNYWSGDNKLAPNSNCAGTASPGGVVAQESPTSPKWTSTFTVSAPSGGDASNPDTATAQGRVELIASGRTYTSNKTVIVNVDQSLTVGNPLNTDTNLQGDGYKYYLNTVMASSGETLCTMGSNARVYCSGRNQYGQLGNGTTTNTSTPVAFNFPSGLTAKTVSNTTQHTCVHASDNNIYCSGDNGNGELGIGNTTNKSTPDTKFILPTNWSVGKLVEVEDNNTCAILLPSNYLYCSGGNTSGELGINTTSATESTPVKFGSTNAFITQMPVSESIGQSGLRCIRHRHLRYEGICLSLNQSVRVDFAASLLHWSVLLWASTVLDKTPMAS